jgi:uncharacterized SAM-dependent methyltransferase
MNTTIIIENIKKEIRDTLSLYLSSLCSDVVLTGTLLQAFEKSARLQVYLGLETENENTNT